MKILSSLLGKFFPSTYAVDQVGAAPPAFAPAGAVSQVDVELQLDGIAATAEEKLTWRMPTPWTW
jgi:hypothetical protein